MKTVRKVFKIGFLVWAIPTNAPVTPGSVFKAHLNNSKTVLRKPQGFNQVQPLAWF